MAFTYAGTGRLFPVRSEDLIGILSYSYSPSVGDPFYYIDNGLVSDPTIDSWVIANHANVTIQSVANDRIVDLVYSGGTTGNYIDYGSINEIQAVTQDDWGLITTSSDVFSFGTHRLSSLSTWSVHKDYVGVGHTLIRGYTYYRLDAPYHGDGHMSMYGVADTFYVPSIATDGVLPLRSLTTTRTLKHQLGTGTLKKFSGAAEAVAFNPEDKQLLFSVHGIGDITFTPNWVSQGTLLTSGNALERVAPLYVGSGTLPTLSSASEQRVFNYDGVSHAIFEKRDYGSVSAPVIDSWVIQAHANQTIQSLANDRIIDLVYSATSGQYLDLGTLLTDGEDTPETVREDWEYIWQGQSRYAMGLYSIGGAAKDNFVPNWNGSGTVRVYGEGIGRTKPRWIAYVRIKVYGDAKPNFSLLAPGGGHLFTINNGDVRRTYAHEGTGSISTFSGAAESTTFNPTERQLLFDINGHGHENFIPNWNSQGTIFWTGSHIVRSTAHEYGSGTLFNFSGGQENVVYDYNPLSHAIFEKRDFGSVSSPVVDSWVIQAHANQTIQSLANDRIIDLVYTTTSGQYLDYNYILIDGQDSPETVREDWEYIWQGVTRYAMGDLEVSGAATTNFSLSHYGSGTIKLWIHGRGRTKPRWVAYVRIGVHGEGDESVVKGFTGSGNLFNFAKAEESRTYDYVGSGELYTVNGAAESIGAKPPETTTHIKISGRGHERFIPNWNSFGTLPVTGYITERTTFHEYGSGILWDFGSGGETRTYDYNVLSSHAIFDYRDYGNVLAPVVDSWVIQAHANQTIQSLANDRIIDLVYTTTTGQYLDYNYILIDGQDSPETVREDYEYIWQTASRYAFGDILIGGASKTNFSLRHIGSGSLFQIGDAMVQFPWSWHGTALIEVTGEAAPAVTYRETGSGVLYNLTYSAFARSYDWEARGLFSTFSGAAESVVFNTRPPSVDLQLSGDAGYSFTPNWNSFGTLPVTGIATEKYGPHYSGSGVLFDLSTFQERRVYSYGESSVDWFIGRDYGSVASPVVDSWVIQNHANVVIETIKDEFIQDLVYTTTSGAYLDYGHIEIPQTVSGLPGPINPADATEDYQWIIDPFLSSTIYPFGAFKIGGEAYTPFGFAHSTTFDYTSGRRADIQVDGWVEVRFPPSHAGTGYIYIGVGDYVKYNFSLRTFGSGSATISGAGSESRTHAPYIGSGRLYGFDGLVESTLVATVPEGTVKVSGQVTEKRTAYIHGSGVISTLSGAAEAVAFSPDEEQMLFSFLGRRLSEKTSVREISKGGVITLSGAGVETVAIAEFSQGVVTLSGIATEKIAPLYVGTGNISTLSGAAEAVTYNPEDITTLFDILGFGGQRVAYSPIPGDGLLSIFGTSGDPLLTFAESGSGVISTTGIAHTSDTDVTTGDGAIFSSGFGGEARTIKLPPMREAHILFSGTGEERVSYNPPEEGTEVILSGAASERYIPNWNGSGTLPLYGQGLESHTEVYTGDGYIFSNGIGGESITVKVPAIQADLLFVGTRLSEKTTVREIGSGVLYNFSGASVTTSIAEISEGLFTISGVGIEKHTENYVGTGRISTLSGAAESVTFNPEDLTTLFDIAGRSTSRTAKSEVKRIEMQIGSTAEPVFFIPDYPGYGVIPVSGDSIIRISLRVIGSGSISTLSGAAESFTYNPEDVTTLFDIKGIGVYRTTKSEVKRIESSIFGAAWPVKFIPHWRGEGVIDVYGDGHASQTKVYTGSGSISTLSGAAESITVNPPDQTTLFEFKGRRISEKTTIRELGTGSLWKWGEVGVNVTFAPKGDGLFKIDGSIEERIAKSFEGEGVLWDFGNGDVRFTYAWEGSGLIDLVGDAHASNTDVATGSGRLYGLAGAAESTAFVPGIEVNTLFVTGEAHIVITVSHVGFGNISTLSGAAESFTYNPEDRTVLFDILGRSSNKVTKHYTVDDELGTLYGSAHESFTRATYEAEVDIATNGDGDERFVITEEGSGSISTFSGAAECVAFSPDEEHMLFSFNGRGHIVRTRAYLGQIEVLISGVAVTNPPWGYHRGKGEMFIRGASDIEFIHAAPARTYGWIV